MGLLGNLMNGEKRISDSLNYINDYKTEIVEDEKGKTRKRLRYVGVWYYIDDEERPAKVKLILSAALCAAAAVCLALSLGGGCIKRGWLLAAVPRLLALLPGLYLLMGAFTLPFRLKPMHRDKYMHSFVRILRSSAAMMIMQGVSLIAKLVYRIVLADWMFLGEDWIGLVSCVVMIACCLGALLLLKSVGIEEKPNSAYDEGLIG